EVAGPLFQGLVFEGEPLDLSRDVARRAREGAGQPADGPVLVAVVAEGPAAAEELEAEVAPDLLDSQDLDRADLARFPDMRTSAGRVVEAVDLDDPQEAVLLGRPPQRDLADPLLGHEVGLDLAVLADDGVGPVLDPVEVGVGEGL